MSVSPPPYWPSDACHTRPCLTQPPPPALPSARPRKRNDATRPGPSSGRALACMESRPRYTPKPPAPPIQPTGPPRHETLALRSHRLHLRSCLGGNPPSAHDRRRPNKTRPRSRVGEKKSVHRATKKRSADKWIAAKTVQSIRCATSCVAPSPRPRHVRATDATWKLNHAHQGKREKTRQQQIVTNNQAASKNARPSQPTRPPPSSAPPPSSSTQSCTAATPPPPANSPIAHSRRPLASIPSPAP